MSDLTKSRAATSPSPSGSRRQSNVPDGHEMTAVALTEQGVKCGYLFKRGGGHVSKAWKKRYFCLANQNLYYFKSEKDKKPQGSIEPLREYEVVEEPASTDRRDGQYLFDLRPKNGSGRIWHIYAASQAEKEDWIEVLQHSTTGGAYHKKTLEIEQKLKRNQYEIPAQDLEWSQGSKDVLGKGASGVVKKGRWLKTTEVAIKALNNLPEFTDEEETVGFYKEIETLSQLRHPNIVPMFGYCKKDGYICLVTEFVKGGNLSECIHDETKPVDFPLILELCLSICRGMVYLHSKNVIHRDLKPGNILVENFYDAKVKVCDFGLSTFTQGKNDSQRTANTFGSPAYAAPELPTATHGKKVDVFSFAVIMWELVSRQKPWTHLSHSWQIAERIASGERLPLPQDCPLLSLINYCWKLDPDERPTFTEIYTSLENVKGGLPADQQISQFAGFSSGGSKGTLRTSSAANNENSNHSMTMTATSRPQHIQTSRTSQSSLSSNSNGSYSGSPALSRLGHNPYQTSHTLEELIEIGFKGQQSITWEEFGAVLKQHLNAETNIMNKLKYCLYHNGDVELDAWLLFSQWFFPLTLPDEVYQTQTNQYVIPNGYTIEEIADIVGNSWFFGKMEASEARPILESRPIGSYLFRFSSQAGMYSLSVNYGQIGHWRIESKKEGSQTTFRIDGRPYRSLHHIIETHKPGEETLAVRNSTVSCYLKFPVDRNEIKSNMGTEYEFGNL